MSAHVSTTRSPARRTPTGRALLVLLAALAITGCAWLWVVLAAPAAASTLVAWVGGTAAIMVCVAVAVAAYYAETTRHARDRVAEINANNDRLEHDRLRLVEDTLPTVVKRVREGASVDTALVEVSHPVDNALQRLLRTVAQEIGEGERMSAAAMAACASAAARVQAQTTRVLAELRELEDRHSEEKVFADLLELDHHISQMGRLADSIVLLSGGRSGRRWTKPIVMESILRGAMGRVDAYQRIRLHSTSTAAVVGHAAEGVMHALAELMDNAATFSAQPTAVHVYVEEENAGIVVTIEDGGLGMRVRERRRAERTVSEPLDLTTLPGTRLGLPVVGRLANKHGLTIHFRPSSRGGTGAVVVIPRQLITQPKQEFPPDAPPPPAEAPAPPSALATSSSSVTPAEDDDKSGELPKRRRGETLTTSRSTTPPATEPTQERRDPGARFAAFRQAGSRGSDHSASSPAEEDAW